ncbi:MAG: hypothetical protein K8I30_01820 [Anaerolineae bacterium]|nr:hypothetical protein [Anaerolineae bacterium]
MPNEITDQVLVALLRQGALRSSDLIAQITDYHGGPVTTEYMITSDIARELIERNYEVEVEYQNRKMINGITMRRSGPPVKKFGSQRTDVAVLKDKIIPLAIIEVKIGVKTLNAIKGDLLKITDTIRSLKPQYASRVRGASIFQVHIAGSTKRYKKEHFKAAIERVEKSLRDKLKAYGGRDADFRFRFRAFQTADEGIVPRELEPDGDSFAWGQHGHATRFYAVLIRSKQSVPPAPHTLAQLQIS